MTSGKAKTRFFVLVLLFVGQFATSIDLRAQQSRGQTVASPSPAVTPSPESLKAVDGPTPVPIASPLQTAPAPKVTALLEGHLELDVIIRVQIDHLAEWAQSHDLTKLVPFINGRALMGNYPEEIHASSNHIFFHLEISEVNDEIWMDLLGEPDGTTRPVTLSVGLENDAPFETVFDHNHRIPLTIISPTYGALAGVVVIGTLVIFIWLARNTSIIREPGPKPVGGKLKPYSLGRTQMAIWFFLIYVSYQAIWLITGALDTITASLLALMGISAGTALSDALIDSGKDSTRTDQLQTLAGEKEAIQERVAELQAQVAALKPGTPATPEDIYNSYDLNKQLMDARTRLNQVSQQVASITPSETSKVSDGFLRDILSDGVGYSFHRFQIFAWTIVLGIMFLSSVYNSLAMPEFSPTLLGLMGISSGTYLGFKFPEKK